MITRERTDSMMEALTLIKVSRACLREIEAYRASFPEERQQVTWNRDRIPGLDHREFDSKT